MSVNFGLKSYIRDANGDGQYTPDEVNAGVSAFSSAQGNSTAQYGGALVSQAYGTVNVTHKLDPSFAAFSGTLGSGTTTQQLTGNGPNTNVGNFEHEEPQSQINFFSSGSRFSFFA